MTGKDNNQIAFSILRVATTTEPRPGESPAARLLRANSLFSADVSGLGTHEFASIGGNASVAAVPPDQRRANGLKGAVARWGAIKERDNSTMPTSRKNLDMNQLAKRILDEATGEAPKTEAPKEAKNQAAVELGRLGGKKGGAARKAALTPEQRSEIAKKAAAGRWQKSNTK